MPIDPAAQLRQLDHLNSQGLLTTAEFQSKRAEIIARLGEPQPPRSGGMLTLAMSERA